LSAACAAIAKLAANTPASAARIGNRRLGAIGVPPVIVVAPATLADPAKTGKAARRHHNLNSSCAFR
jgi:hypothetical protein